MMIWKVIIFLDPQIKLLTVDIEIERSGLRVSNTKVTRAGNFRELDILNPDRLL